MVNKKLIDLNKFQDEQIKMHNVDAPSMMRATYTAIESTDPNEHITVMIYSSLEMSRDFIYAYTQKLCWVCLYGEKCCQGLIDSRSKNE